MWKTKITVAALVFIPCIFFSFFQISLSHASQYRALRGGRACAAIAIYASLTSMRYPTSLEEIINQIDWSEGNKVSVHKMMQYLDDYSGIEAKQVLFDTDGLRTHLQNGDTAILFFASNSSDLDHAIAFVSVNGEQFSYFSYPDGLNTISMTELNLKWSGEAIILTDCFSHKLYRNRDILALTVIAVGIVFVIAIYYGAKTMKNPLS